MRKRVLFVCTHNSARSQMAEGLLKAKHGDRYKVTSAGPEPSQVHPMAVQAMAEIGIDISQHSSQHVDQFLGREFDHVVTVCDLSRESCPFFPGAKEYSHASFPDPSEEIGQETNLAAFRQVRDLISDWVDVCFGKPSGDPPASTGAGKSRGVP